MGTIFSPEKDSYEVLFSFLLDGHFLETLRKNLFDE